MRKQLIIFLLAMLTPLLAHSDVIFPAPLKAGDRIAIVAPSGHVERHYVDEAAQVIREQGYEPVVYPTIDMHTGQFSGTKQQRLADLSSALTDPSIRAVLCARGGYGMVHLLDSLATLDLAADPKWVIGFSDISALHALLASKGIASIHSPMARHIGRGMNHYENQSLFRILRNDFPAYNFEPHPLNHPGDAEGKLLGGNLAVLQALIDTPYDIIQPGTILFIEDVDEPVYKVERMLYQLKLSGVLGKLNGLIVGQFTGYKPDPNHASMEAMIAEVLSDYPELPVAFNAPVGHVESNLPLVESSTVRLHVSPTRVTLRPQ